MKRDSMNRREFLFATGCAAVALPLATALSGCGGGGGTPATTATTAGDFTITSSTTGATHEHSITIKAADLTAGLQVVYTSTQNGSGPHSHTVTVTPEQFTDINAGKSDNISSSTDFGHHHDFPIKKP